MAKIRQSGRGVNHTHTHTLNMKITKLLAAIASAAAVASVPAQAALITYNFVQKLSPSSAYEFTAQASFDNSLVGGGWITASPAKFSASMTRKSDLVVRNWDLGEINYSQFQISKTGVLTYNALTATDTAALSGPFFHSYLNGASTGFSSPGNVGGSWQQIVAAPPAPAVPDPGPGALAVVVVLGMGIVARRQRRRRLTA